MKFNVQSKKITIGEHKGETGYIAHPSTNQKRSLKSIVESIVETSSLSEGDMSNAVISLFNEIKKTLTQGIGVDLGARGSLKVLVPSRVMLREEDVTAQKALKTPHVVYYPRRELKEAVARVQCVVDNPKNRNTNNSGTSTPSSGNTDPGNGGNGGTTPGGNDNPDGIE